MRVKGTSAPTHHFVLIALRPFFNKARQLSDTLTFKDLSDYRSTAPRFVRRLPRNWQLVGASSILRLICNRARFSPLTASIL